MAFVTNKEMLLAAQKNKFGVPAFNVENMEMVQAVIAAGTECSSPVMIQTTPSTLKYASPDLFFAMVKNLAEKAPVPVALHLDHGDSFELCKAALDAGYSSIMIDGSKLSFEENIALSKRVVEICKAKNIPVEAELGTVGGKEDTHEVLDADAKYTNPGKAVTFVEETGIQSLAVAIGTAHGHYKDTPKLQFERLSEIKEVVSIPLVLHGTSGVPDGDVVKCIGLGICKINYATELRDAYTLGLRKVLADTAVFDPKAYGKEGREYVKALCKKRMEMCGSASKA
ncbi:fructose-bisphosphate aldolase [Spirochaetia bacterium]|nr:fructose-bisphosphate aldolase [Spirochaetia bacterium]